MKLFIITSPKFSGSAEILFNEEDVLAKVDLTQTNMDETKVGHFLAMLPTSVDGLSQAFAKTSVTIVASDYKIDFEAFYNEYPLKRNAFRVKKAFAAMSKNDQVKAFVSLKAYKTYLTRETWQTPMIGDRYLRDREYETEWNKI